MSLLRKFLRYATVSIVATVISQTVLVVLVATNTTGAVTANLIATMCGVVPSFELNRRWVWRKQGRRSLRSEVVPFVALTGAGLLLSSIGVAIASAVTAHDATATRTLVIEAANISAYGLVWLVQFALLDRFLFRVPPPTAVPRDGAAGTPRLAVRAQRPAGSRSV